MKRKIIFLSFLFLFLFYYGPLFIQQIGKNSSAVSERPIAGENKLEEEQVYPLPVSGFERYIGNPIEEYADRHGQPLRIGASGTGGEWWIYGNSEKDYVQIEVEAGIVESIFVLGEDIYTGIVHIGMTRENLYDETELAEEFYFSAGEAAYSLTLSKNEWQAFPLVRFENGSFAALFFHPETQEVYGLRYLSPQALLRTNFYSVQTEEPGVRTAVPPLLAWDEKVEEEKQEQLVAFFSIIRKEAGLPALYATEEMRRLAASSSKSFAKNQWIFADKADPEKQNALGATDYYLGKGVYDTPMQFGLFMAELEKRQFILDPNAEEIGIKAIGDDLLLLLK